MKLKINKTNASYCVYKMSDYCIICTDIIEKLGVIVYMKLHFHRHADDIFFQSVKTLGFILSITLSFWSLDSLLMLYLTPPRPRTWACLNFMELNNVYRRQKNWNASNDSSQPLVKIVVSPLMTMPVTRISSSIYSQHTRNGRSHHLDALFLLLFMQD